MKYLLDTCLLSELVKKSPSITVLKWLDAQQESNLLISVLTIGEIEKGIEKLIESSQKQKLKQWVTYDLRQRFKNRIVSIDENIATQWGRIQARAEKKGHSMPSIDGLIAATGKTLGYTVVTRNTSDMQESGAVLFNPWEI